MVTLPSDSNKYQKSLITNHSKTYCSKIGPNLEKILRYEFNTNSYNLHEIFPITWFVFYDPKSIHDISFEINKARYVIKSNQALYLSPNTLIQWQIPQGKIEWKAYRSNQTLPKTLEEKFMLFNWNSNLIFENEKNLIRHLEEINLRNYQKPYANFKNHLIFEIQNWIHFNFTEEFKLSDLAKKYNMSSSNLSHLFYNQFGISPIKYRNQLRIQLAAWMLGSKDISATQACFESGFCDFSRFYRQFCDFYGVSPSQYTLKRLKKNYLNEMENNRSPAIL